jgi:hypothetical protein
MDLWHIVKIGYFRIRIYPRLKLIEKFLQKKVLRLQHYFFFGAAFFGAGFFATGFFAAAAMWFSPPTVKGYIPC